VFGSIVFATLDFLFGSRSPHLRLVELRCYLAGRIVLLVLSLDLSGVGF